MKNVFLILKDIVSYNNLCNELDKELNKLEADMLKRQSKIRDWQIYLQASKDRPMRFTADVDAMKADLIELQYKYYKTRSNYVVYKNKKQELAIYVIGLGLIAFILVMLGIVLINKL